MRCNESKRIQPSGATILEKQVQLKKFKLKQTFVNSSKGKVIRNCMRFAFPEKKKIYIMIRKFAYGFTHLHEITVDLNNVQIQVEKCLA